MPIDSNWQSCIRDSPSPTVSCCTRMPRFAGYETWRNQVAGMQVGMLTQQAEVLLFNAQVPVAPTNNRVRRVNGNMLMTQLKRQVQMAGRRGMNSSTRKGSFVITKSQRNPTALFGAGLIDSIPTEVLDALEQAQTKNRIISGRVARLKDGSAGRFGWKSQKSRLSNFVLTACAVEVGLNVPNHPQAGHPKKADYRPAGLDLNQAQCDALIDYIAELVGSKNSAELEIVLSTVVAAAWISKSQLLDFTHGVSESGRLSCR
jgi:CxxC motif-containing protein (DUF1111 family)